MHTKDITFPELVKMLHWQFFHSLTVTLGISLIKLSVAFFLLRLVSGKAYKWFLYGMIGKLPHTPREAFYVFVVKKSGLANSKLTINS
jgi:hypothetical protein